MGDRQQARVFWRVLTRSGRIFLIAAMTALLVATVVLLLDLNQDQTSIHRLYQAIISLSLSIFATCLVGFTLDFWHERETREQALNTIRIFGLDRVVGRGPLGGTIAIVVPSFSGAESVLGQRSHWDGLENPPRHFVHGNDDISRDFFFGKRDVALASQVASAIARAGNPSHIFVEDRHLWAALTADTSTDHGALIVNQDNERHAVDSVVVVGLWSNIVATALADCDFIGEFGMDGDPESHSTRIVKFNRPDGLTVMSMQAVDEADLAASNPAVLMSVRLRDVHVTLIGGATSLSTLRLAEYLSVDDNWARISNVSDDDGRLINSDHGFWMAFQCPNSSDFRDRTQVVSSGRISDNRARLLREVVPQ